MGKIGLCGHYSEKESALNGQTVKTKILTEALSERFGAENIIYCDTHNCRKHPIKFFINCVKMFRQCDNIIMLPAQSALPVLTKFFTFLNKFYHRGLHYYVVGGWLCDALKQNVGLINKLQKFNGIYVELKSMKCDLHERGFSNIYYVPKFRKLNVIDEEEIPSQIPQVMNLCIFSRVMKEKGIEDAALAVEKANTRLGYVAYTLDIYGQVDVNYKERFEEIKKTFPKEVSYSGVVDFRESTNVLKNYFALLFPTYYVGEGYANTIVDAFAAGLPVIATDWKYNSEVINDGEDGIIYKVDDKEALVDILLDVAKNPEIVFSMKNNARKRAFEYDPQNAIKALVDNLN